MSEPFFQSLRNKLLKSPSRRFDSVFWKKFGNEFHTPTASGFRRWQWAGSLATVLLVTLLVWKQSWKPVEILDEDLLVAADLEMFETEDVASLTEEEWKLLLEEKKG